MKNEIIKIKNGAGEVEGCLSVPDGAAAAGGAKFPAIIIIHEIWGLNDQIKGVADRFAKELGYLAFAPDLMKGEVGNLPDPSIFSETDPVKRDEGQKKMRDAMAPIQSPEFAVRTVGKLEAIFDFLKNHENSNGTVGILGFCFGGTYAFALAGAEPDLKFAISYYGSAPADDVIAKIACPVLAFYGDQDERLMTTLPALIESMRKHGKNFRSITYPGVGHAFFNEKNTRMYNAEAAGKAWEEMKAFLNGLKA